MVISLKKGYRDWRRLDTYCMIVSIVGVLIWLLSDSPEWAVGLFIATSLVAMVPTLRHAWNEPHAETWQTFAINLVSSFLTLLAITKSTFVAVSIPLYVAGMSLVLVALILGRRRYLNRPSKVSLA